ncbi:MAG: hypothetical protein ACNYNY_04535 [Candidatus Oxydemutatoraceae bacterium WSBS_2016_MAG_OTU14]
MYLFHYDFGGMTSQVMTTVVAQTVADLTGLQYIHVPNKQNLIGEEKDWKKILQWSQYAGVENCLPEPPVHFIMHFFQRRSMTDGGAYSMRKFMLVCFEKAMAKRFLLTPGKRTYEVRVHKGEVNLSLFEKGAKKVHVLLENSIGIDFTERHAQALVRTRFEKIKQLFLQNLKAHPIAKRLNKRVVHVAIHLRTGDILEQTRPDIRNRVLDTLLKKEEFSKLLDASKRRLLYQLSYLQMTPLVHSVINTLECEGVLYKVSLYTLKPDALFYTLMRKIKFKHPVEIHIGGNRMDTFLRMASSDIIISQSGGFARFAGLLGGKFVLFSRNRPAFLSKHISLLSAESPLFDKNQTWALSTPSDLFRLKGLIKEVLDNKCIL